MAIAKDVKLTLQDLEAGDVVWLNSGGPPMTIAWISSETNEVRCLWFPGGGEAVMSETFFACMLSLVPPVPRG